MAYGVWRISVLCYLFRVAFTIALALVYDLAFALPENHE